MTLFAIWVFIYEGLLIFGPLAKWFVCSPICAGDRGSISGRVIPKTQKMVLDAALLSTQHYKVRIKGKGGALGVVVIVVGNGHGDMSSNPGRD